MQPSAAELRVLGVDPGTAVTGYGIVARVNGGTGRLVECGIIRTNPNETTWQRLVTLYDGVRELITRHEPAALALESVFYGKNVRTALTLGHARGVILLAATQAGLEVAEFPPARVKKSVTGVGSATKPQVGYMVKQMLHLREAPSPSDAADGVALALAYLLANPPGR